MHVAITRKTKAGSTGQYGQEYTDDVREESPVCSEEVQGVVCKESVVATEDEFALASAAEVRVECYGSHLISRSGYTIRMSLEDCLLCSAALQHGDLALVVDNSVQIQKPINAKALCADAQRIFFTDNAGGSAEVSEAFSMELLHRTIGARLEKTEMELKYFTGNGSGSKITDFSMLHEGAVIGVSVTRACRGYPTAYGAYTREDAFRLLSKKFIGVKESTKFVVNSSWEKQLLHIFAPDTHVMAMLRDAYDELDHDMRGNTIMLITLCSGFHSRAIFKQNEGGESPAKKKSRTLLGMKDCDHLRHLQASDPCRA